MRVLLDSNVLARATPGKTSAAREVLLLVTQAPHHLLTSAPLLTELARILQYPRVRVLHGLDDAGIQAYLQAVQGSSLVVTPLAPPPIHTRDPADDLVIATAAAGQAEVLCTWDRHLHDASIKGQCLSLGIRVLKDAELLQELRNLASPPPATP
jgi:putative PIN family toxin of toxin-antitoxin system